jgi:AcrR family transcriptional regulator
MARPREFDEAAVLDAAIARFWQHGYEATSVRDLADEMNIAGASLYNAFGDKRTLYERALNRYLDQSLKRKTSLIRRIDNLWVGIGLPHRLNEKPVVRLSCRPKRPAPPKGAHDRLKSLLTML